MAFFGIFPVSNAKKRIDQNKIHRKANSKAAVMHVVRSAWVHSMLKRFYCDPCWIGNIEMNDVANSGTKEREPKASEWSSLSLSLESDLLKCVCVCTFKKLTSDRFVHPGTKWRVASDGRPLTVAQPRNRNSMFRRIYLTSFIKWRHSFDIMTIEKSLLAHTAYSRQFVARCHCWIATLQFHIL